MAMAGRQGVDPTTNCCDPPPTFPSPSSSQNPNPPLAPVHHPPLVPAQQPLLPPCHVVQVGYQSYLCPVVAEGTPVIVKRERPLPCCGVGIGWALFLAGFFLAAVPWYVGTFILLFVAMDSREKTGLVACTVAAALAAVAAIFPIFNNNLLW